MKKRTLKLILLLTITFTPTVLADCFLGTNTTKDVYGALKIFKIVAPLLMLGYTIFDLVKMLATGAAPGGKEAPPPKQVASRFVKRLVAVLILFIVPVLVNQVFVWAGIWNDEGMCDLSEGDIDDDGELWANDCSQIALDSCSKYSNCKIYKQGLEEGKCVSNGVTKEVNGVIWGTTKGTKTVTTNGGSTTQETTSGSGGTNAGGIPSKGYTVPSKYKTSKCPLSPTSPSDDKYEMENFLKMAQNLDSTLDNYFKVAGALTGVNSNLLKAVAFRESGFKYANKGTNKYGGYMGVSLSDKWGDAKNMGLSDARSDINNILLGAGTLAQKINAYNGDLTAALMAYNKGSGFYNEGANSSNPSEEWKNCKKYYAGRVINYYNALNAADPTNDAKEADLSIFGGAA